MDKLKQWVTLTVVGVLVIGAAGYFLLISPKRSEAADVRSQADREVSDNKTLASQITDLKAQRKELPRQQAKLAAVAAKLPDNPALPSLIRALSAAADDANVELISLAPSAPTAVTTVGAPAAAAAVPVAGAAAKTAPSATAGASGALQVIGLTINVAGGYFQVEQFLDKVENLTRATKVTGLTMAKGANPIKPVTTTAGTAAVDHSDTLNAIITGSVYMASGRSTTAPTAAGK